tara:strand:+ start:153 stop:602 length:450 start_codon:yes stop_codon:yes gene_type:complete
MKLFALVFTLNLFIFLPAQAEITAMQPEIRLGIGERPGVMFATLLNKGAATRLFSAKSPSFARIELHTHRKMPNGIMRMVQADDFAVPANGILTLKPGGHHLMLFGYQGQKGENVSVTLHFADKRAVTVLAPPLQRNIAGDKKLQHHSH